MSRVTSFKSAVLLGKLQVVERDSQENLPDNPNKVKTPVKKITTANSNVADKQKGRRNRDKLSSAPAVTVTTLKDRGRPKDTKKGG